MPAPHAPLAPTTYCGGYQPRLSPLITHIARRLLSTQLPTSHYARAAATWYERLIARLEDAAQLDPLQRRIHLLGVGKPSWMLPSPLVMSFDSSGPARMALLGNERGIARYCARIGLPWQRVDEAALLDDRETAWPSVLEQED